MVSLQNDLLQVDATGYGLINYMINQYIFNYKVLITHSNYNYFYE